jgi:YggT family protein
MAAQALIFVLETVFKLFVMAVMIRLLAQLMRVPFRRNAGNPLIDFIFALTDWCILPLRRLLPALGRVDLAGVLVALTTLSVLGVLVTALMGVASIGNPTYWLAVLLYALVEFVQTLLYVLFGLIIIDAILSWVNPRHPIRPFFSALTEPILRPIRRIIPLVGGVDLSPLVALILLQVLIMFPLAVARVAVLQSLRPFALG